MPDAEGMIAGYNRRQVLRAVLALLLSAIAYALGFFFFEFAAAFSMRLFDRSWSVHAPAFACAALALCTLSTYLRLRKGKGRHGYHESGLLPDFKSGSAGAYLIEREVRMITGPAYLLGQIFLAGPMQFFKAIALLRSLIRTDPGLEQRLRALLEEITVKNKWESADVYRGREEELVTLIAMDRIDYSRTRNMIHAKG